MPHYIHTEERWEKRFSEGHENTDSIHNASLLQVSFKELMAVREHLKNTKTIIYYFQQHKGLRKVGDMTAAAGFPIFCITEGCDR